ncbi:unnamed protein product [Heterosigma akashiwo]
MGGIGPLVFQATAWTRCSPQAPLIHACMPPNKGEINMSHLYFVKSLRYAWWWLVVEDLLPSVDVDTKNSRAAMQVHEKSLATQATPTPRHKIYLTTTIIKHQMDSTIWAAPTSWE